MEKEQSLSLFNTEPFTYITTQADNSQMLIHSFHPVSWLTGVILFFYYHYDYSDLASSCFQLLNPTSTAVLRLLPVMTGAHLVQCFVPVLILHPAFLLLLFRHFVCLSVGRNSRALRRFCEMSIKHGAQK